MSQENVDLNFRSHDAFNRRDLEAFLALNDPDVQFTPYERVIEGLGPYRGHDGVRLWWEETFAALPDLHVELDEVRDLGDMTLVRGCLRGHGAASGAFFERTYWGVFRWRDRRTVWWHAFQTEAEALKAAGASDWAMSQENVDLVRSIFADWESGDYDSSVWADAAIEYVIADGPAPGSWKGLAGLAEGARANVESWEDMRFELADYRELDDERVLVLHSYRGRGKTSGVEVRAAGAQLFHIRDDKVTRLVHYWDRNLALADLGLKE